MCDTEKVLHAATLLARVPGVNMAAGVGGEKRKAASGRRGRVQGTQVQYHGHQLKFDRLKISFISPVIDRFAGIYMVLLTSDSYRGTFLHDD